MSEQRTEKASPRRREKARESGQVLRSREAASAVGLACGAAALFLTAGWWRREMQTLLQAALAQGEGVDLKAAGLHALVSLAGPPLAAAFAGTGLALAAQEPRLTLQTKSFLKGSRLSPQENIKKLFSSAALIRILKSLLPAIALIWIGYREMVAGPPVGLAARGAGHAASQIFAMLWSVVWRSVAVLLGWGAIDYAMEWWRHERGLRMTKEEQKKEARESDGNPQTKAKIRRLQRQLRRSRMLQEVKRATVVVTNPTHFAVAIEFHPERMPAPVVVAKGVDNLALQIKALARHHDVPQMENRPLAQALFRSAQVGEMVPPKLYAAVAEVLAFVYRTEAELQARQMRRGGERP